MINCSRLGPISIDPHTSQPPPPNRLFHSSLAQELPELGIDADVVTFNALLTALANAQPLAQWERSLRLLRSLPSRGVSPDIISYNAVLSALGKGGQWRRALALLDSLRKAERQRLLQQDELDEKGGEAAEAAVVEWAAEKGGPGGLVNPVAAEALMRRFSEEGGADGKPPRPPPSDVLDLDVKGDADDNDNIGPPTTAALPAPDLISYTSTISACAEVGQWKPALEVLAQIREAGIAPSTLTYSRAIAALEKGGEWARACDLLQATKAQHEPQPLSPIP